MFDLKAIRADPAAFDAGLEKRGFESKAAQILDLDDQRRELQTRLQALLRRRYPRARMHRCLLVLTAPPAVHVKLRKLLALLR